MNAPSDLARNVAALPAHRTIPERLRAMAERIERGEVSALACHDGTLYRGTGWRELTLTYEERPQQEEVGESE